MQTATQTFINWDSAAKAAARLAPAGPQLGAGEIAEVVRDLRAKADRSVPLVHELTKLDAAKDLSDSQVLIVDRAGWAKANTQSFEVLMDPLISGLAHKAMERAQERSGKKPGKSGAAVPKTEPPKLAAAVAGGQVGVILAFLASKVLGQYEPFGRNSTAAGRLLLVAPNIVEVERELGVNTDDFRLWVCLHEQTHRVQFAAAPWLQEHMIEQINALTEDLAASAGDFTATLSNAGKEAQKQLAALKGKKRRALGGAGGTAEAGTDNNDGADAPDTQESAPGVLNLFGGKKSKERLSHLTAVMSLLEGHATVIMDAVDASIVPTVKTIRQRFNARGASKGPLESFFRKALGLDAKAKQYVLGASFVRGVIDASDIETFNKVWEKPENLPREPELEHPEQWLERVAGIRA